MSEINIEIPAHLLHPGKYNQINFDAMENKSIIALMGYAKSGKDFIAKKFVEEYGYKKIGFADNVKRDMNSFLKDQVVKDVFEKTGVILKDLDFFSEIIEIKKTIRPYIIWYAEKLREINGIFYWINKAFEFDGKDAEKIIISDLRRLPELNIFKDSMEFNKRTITSFTEAGVYKDNVPYKNFSTLLFEVNQFGLKDSDQLTIDTILEAREQWLIDDTFYVDSRLPQDGGFRKKAIDIQIKKIVKKFGIEKPDKTKHVQTTIFQKTEN